MPHIKTSDGVSLYYEETGSGAPLIFLHEFGGHYLSWEPQVRYFSRRYRCITYAARGWPPSDVPNDVAKYSQARAADDCADLMKALGIDKAHLCGLSMGATAGLEFAIRHPGKATALVIAAGGGGGSTDPEAKKRFKEECEAFAQRIEKEGMPAMAELYCTSSARNTYRYKDPRGWAEFKQQFADGSAVGPRHDHARRAGIARAVLRAHRGAAEDRRADAGGDRRRGRLDARPRRPSQAARAALAACSSCRSAATP